MNIRQERAEFETWWDGLPQSMKSLLAYEVAKQAYELGRAALQSRTLCVDALAQEIRRVDGSHSLGAGALSESLMPFIQSALQSQDREDAERYRRLRIGDIDDIAVVCGLGTMDYGMSAVIGTYSEEIDGDDLDAAIDNAR